MTQLCKIHLGHVAGMRMIQQGTDGLSHERLCKGALKGEGIIDIIPTHLTSLTQSPELESWLRSWLGEGVEFLDPVGLFR